MSTWGAVKAKRLLAALLRNGWAIKRASGSHRTLTREGWPDFVFAFHDSEEIGPRMMRASHVIPGCGLRTSSTPRMLPNKRCSRQPIDRMLAPLALVELGCN